MDAHGCSDTKVEVGKDAVTRPVPEPHDEPGESRKAQGHKVPQAGPFPCPSNDVEDDEASVEDEEQPIDYVQHCPGHISIMGFPPAKVGPK
jgi:hypothetical protein